MSTPTTEQGVDPVPAALDRSRVPVHVACVMDGNGRWASARGLPRTEGHTMGETALFDVVKGALEIGIGWLTVYAFSTENWRRPDRRSAVFDGFQREPAHAPGR